MKLKPRDLLRKSEATYKGLGLSRDDFSDDELVELMLKHPELIQRPIVERGSRAVLGRTVENIRAVISDE